MCGCSLPLKASPLLAPVAQHLPPLFQLEDAMLEVTHGTNCSVSNFALEEDRDRAWWLWAQAAMPHDYYYGWEMPWPKEPAQPAQPACQPSQPARPHLPAGPALQFEARNPQRQAATTAAAAALPPCMATGSPFCYNRSAGRFASRSREKSGSGRGSKKAGSG